MPIIELKKEILSPVETIYEILNDYLALPRWNIIVTECTQLESKKYFLKTNVGDITNIEVENIPHEKMTSIQKGSPMQKIGYIFEPKDNSTLVTLWAEFELDDQKEIMEMAGDLFLKSLKVYADYLSAGGNPEEYKKSFSKIKKA
ncbi:MAG: SRPBCC family protein [Candidatus Lokiarchaeota archaeon]|nr:SRPBCC family protein [Candidatus Lokiarchaeota archaeon]